MLFVVIKNAPYIAQIRRHRARWPLEELISGLSRTHMEMVDMEIMVRKISRETNRNVHGKQIDRSQRVQICKDRQD